MLNFAFYCGFIWSNEKKSSTFVAVKKNKSIWLCVQRELSA